MVYPSKIICQILELTDAGKHGTVALMDYQQVRWKKFIQEVTESIFLFQVQQPFGLSSLQWTCQFFKVFSFTTNQNQ